MHFALVMSPLSAPASASGPFATACGLQVDGFQINAAFSHLLETTFFGAPSALQPTPEAPMAGAKGAAGSQGGDEGRASGRDSAGPDLEMCTRVLDVWRRLAAAAGARVAPLSARATEAAAAVQMVGQLQYKAGGCCTEGAGLLGRAEASALREARLCDEGRRGARGMGQHLPLLPLPPASLERFALAATCDEAARPLRTRRLGGAGRGGPSVG